MGLALVAGIALSLAACGGGGASDACVASCDAQGKGEGCTQKVADNCKALCDLVAGGLSGSCADVAVTYFDCLSTMKWTCSAGSELATSTDTKCNEETTAYTNACNGS